MPTTLSPVPGGEPLIFTKPIEIKREFCKDAALWAYAFMNAGLFDPELNFIDLNKFAGEEHLGAIVSGAFYRMEFEDYLREKTGKRPEELLGLEKTYDEKYPVPKFRDYMRENCHLKANAIYAVAAKDDKYAARYTLFMTKNTGILSISNGITTSKNGADKVVDCLTQQDLSDLHAEIMQKVIDLLTERGRMTL